MLDINSSSNHTFYLESKYQSSNITKIAYIKAIIIIMIGSTDKQITWKKYR